jgi:outer membrane protein TolC
MTKKIAAFLILASLCAARLCAQQYRIKYSPDDKEPISIENAIRLALENSYDLLMMEQEVIIAKQRLYEAKFLYLPQFSVNASATTYNADYPSVMPDSVGLRFLEPTAGQSRRLYGAGARAEQYVYAGGRISGTASLANASLKEAKNRYESVKASVIFNVKQVFFEYLFQRQKQTLAKEVLVSAQAVLSGASGGKLENILVKSELAAINSEAAQTDEDVSSAHLNLLKALNKEPNGKVEISGNFDFEPLEADLNKAMLWAMEFRPELKSVLYKLEMDNIAVKLSLAKRYPDVMLGVSYDKLGQNVNDLSDDNFQATLSLKLPLGYDFASRLKQKRAEQRQTILKRASITDSIRAQVTEAYNNLTFWQKEAAVRAKTWGEIRQDYKNLKNTPASKEQSAKALEYYYKTGVRYLEGVKRCLLAKIQLEFAIGRDLNDHSL